MKSPRPTAAALAFLALTVLPAAGLPAAETPRHELAVSGTRFELDGQPFPFTGVSFFNAIYNPSFNQDSATRREWLRKFQKYGVNVLRIWAARDSQLGFVDAGPDSTLYHPDGRLREQHLATLKAILRDADAEGMVVQLCLFSHNNWREGIRFSPEAAGRAVESLTRELQPWRNLAFQIWNEHHDEQALPLVKVIKARDPKRLVTSTPGFGGVLGPKDLNEALDYLTPHTSRQSKGRPWELAPREIAQLLVEFRKPVVDDEPARNGIADHGGPQGATSPYDHIMQIYQVWQVGGYVTYHHNMYHTGYGSPAVPPSGIPDPEFSPYHKQVFEFLALRDRYMPGNVSSTQGANYSVGNSLAVKFGVYEIVLTGDGAVANPFDTPFDVPFDTPFDTVATVKFSPPSGEKNARTVHAFFDGDNTWRARVYVSEVGEWKWSSRCDTDNGLNGKSGTFKADDSRLRGRLLPHPKNPRHWMTEDGRWFLNLSDTPYFLLCKFDGNGEPIPFGNFTAYVRDAVSQGITSVRSIAVSGPKSYDRTGTLRWDAIFADAGLTAFRVGNFQETDRRLQWLLDNYPDLYVQFILLPRGVPWRRDETFWTKMSGAQKERLLRYLIARYAAYPQIFWLIVNDAHYAPDNLNQPDQVDVEGVPGAPAYPNNIAMAREVGAYFKQHDPWQHPLSTGHTRTVPFQFGAEDWASYIHLEDSYAVGAAQYEQYHRFAKPVFFGEDHYEHAYHPDRTPTHMRYFQRRLFWAWLLSGGSANYGGRQWTVVPYSQTGRTAATHPFAEKGLIFTAQLTGLDSVRFIRDYFAARKIEISDFEPDQTLVEDADGATGVRAPKLMRRGQREFLIYHPNAAADGRDARVDGEKTPGVVVNLSAANGKFAVEWYRADDGATRAGAVIEGGARQTLRSPWRGQDCVVRLRQIELLVGLN